MEHVNTKFLNDLITKILVAAKDGTSLNISNPDDVGQFVLTIIGLGAGLIPVVGSSLGALCDLLGAVIFSHNSTEQIWDALRARIEQLIDSKIEEYHLRILRAKILGFQSNMASYSQSVRDFENASTAEAKQQTADTLKIKHIAFLSVIMAGIPEFQVANFAVPSLPLFSLVATMHLSLLADGIKNGKGWGYSDADIATWLSQFKAKVSPSTGVAVHDILPLLKDAISSGAQANLPDELLDTWKDAHDALQKTVDAPADGDEDLDYVTYAKKIAAQGRSSVKPAEARHYAGYQEASDSQAYSNYDTSMILNVLNYAELWPFMTGDPMTDSAARNVDREIFYGPYGRWADGAAWSSSSPPPLTDRGPPITSINVRAWDDIDGLEVKHGSSWDGFQGNRGGGAPKAFDIGADEYITSVNITYGFKLGRLAFTTNKNNQLQNGNARHADVGANIAPPGYELTSVRITRWVGDTPTGCEGVILGFRPLMTDTAQP